MNPSTNETQTSPSVLNAQRWDDIDQELENAACLLRLLSDQHTASMHYPAFEVIQTILEQVRSDLSGLSKGSHIPNPLDPALILSAKNQNAVLVGIMNNALYLLALNKAIGSWARDHSEGDGSNNPMDVGHIFSLAELAANTAQTIIDMSDLGFVEEVAA